MTLWKSKTAKNVWLENWCCLCYRMKTPCTDCTTPEECRQANYNCGHLELKDPGCPILARANRIDRKPVQWDRNMSADHLMKAAYRCNEFRKDPPRAKPKGFVDVPMFDIGAPVDHIHYVPVEGWPDDPKHKDTDHA
jgi:hypothetical protein